MADRDDAPLAPHLRSAAPEDRQDSPGEAGSRPGTPDNADPPSPPTDAPDAARPSATAPAGAARPAAAASAAEPTGAAGAAGAAEPAGAAGLDGRGVGALARRTWQRTTAAGRAIRVWSRRPNGQLAVPALLLAGLIAVTGTGGAVVVPALAGGSARGPVDAAPDVSAQPSAAEASASAGPVPTGPAATAAPVPPAGVPTALGTAPAPSATVAGPPGRPSDVLAGWAQRVGDRAGVPPAAMQAYGYAELVLAQTNPGCHLTWTTLAAIGSVESNHGRANGATLTPDGQALPPIIGLPLDGQGGRQRIADTDRGQLDGDPVLDRAVGPMQFIPSTWVRAGVDADNDGAANPHDIDDAALAAANYLCANGRDLTTAADWWAAILSYNAVRPYAQAVFDTATRYGVSSRT